MDRTVAVKLNNTDNVRVT